MQDLGFEPTLGATPAIGERMRRTKAQRDLIGSGTSGGGVSGGASFTLTDMHKMHGQPAPGRRKKVAPTASPHKDQRFSQPAQGPTLNGPVGGGTSGGGISGGKRSNARNELVRKNHERAKYESPSCFEIHEYTIVFKLSYFIKYFNT